MFSKDDNEDLNNRSIEMYSTNSTKHSSIGSLGNNNKNEDNQTKASVKSFINNFKYFMKSKMNLPIDSENNILQEQDKTDSINSSSSFSETKEENCKDKVLKKIINSIEVNRNIPIFVTFLGLGSLLICISIFLLPLIITAPSKFSFSFSFGSIFILISFLFLKGTKAYFTTLFESKRLCISICYVLSIFIGIGFSLGSHYFISLLCTIFQVFSLVLFVLSFVPGCQCSINYIKSKLSSPFTKVIMGAAEHKINNL